MMRWRQKAETHEELCERLAQLEQEMVELDQKTPQEMAGHRFETSYHARNLSRALEAGDHEAARQSIDALLCSAPDNGAIRLTAAIAYYSLGEPGEEALQLAIGLAVDPDNFALHSRLARILLQRGDREVAAAILEQGWLRQKKHWGKKDQAARRAQYFAMLDQAQPEDTAG